MGIPRFCSARRNTLDMDCLSLSVDGLKGVDPRGQIVRGIESATIFSITRMVLVSGEWNDTVLLTNQ